MRTPFLLLCAMLTLSSCLSMGSGPPAKEFPDKVKQVQVGTTTRAQIVALFGSDPASSMLPQDHSDLEGNLPPNTPEGEVERLVYIGAIDVDTANTEMLFVYIDSAGKVCSISYDEPW